MSVVVDRLSAGCRSRPAGLCRAMHFGASSLKQYHDLVRQGTSHGRRPRRALGKGYWSKKCRRVVPTALATELAATEP